MYKKALGIKLKTLGEEHSSVADTYNNMAIVLNRQGKYDEAMAMYKKALGIHLRPWARSTLLWQHVQQHGNRVEQPRQVRRGHGDVQEGAGYQVEDPGRGALFCGGHVQQHGNRVERPRQADEAMAMYKERWVSS